MDRRILTVTQEDLDFLTNDVFNLNKSFDVSKESYKIELLELINMNEIKIFYVHDFYKNNIPTLEHHNEIIKLDDLYKKYNGCQIEQRLKEIIENKSLQNIQI